MRGLVVVAALGVVSWIVGCSDPPPEQPAPTAPRSATQLAPDALMEGRIDAFGLRLPEGSAVKRRTPGTLTVEVPASLDKTLDYVRARTKGTEQRKGKRVFIENATMLEGSSTKLRIVLRASSVATEVTVSTLESEVDDEPVFSEATPPPTASASAGGAPSADRPTAKDLEAR